MPPPTDGQDALYRLKDRVRDTRVWTGTPEVIVAPSRRHGRRERLRLFMTAVMFYVLSGMIPGRYTRTIKALSKMIDAYRDDLDADGLS